MRMFAFIAELDENIENTLMSVKWNLKRKENGGTHRVSADTWLRCDADT